MKGLSRSKRHGNRPSKKPTVAYAPWDMGADGPSNRHRLTQEAATDIDPETGKETPNPNNVKRMRRRDWVEVYARRGDLDLHHVAAARKLRLASEGLRERDPLAAIGEVRHRASPGDAAAARIDARRYYHQLWATVPTASRWIVERVVIEDQAIPRGGNPQQRERHKQRLRDGLDAIR